MFQKLEKLKFGLKTICLTETWCVNSSDLNSHYKLNNYATVHQIKSHDRTDGICIFIYNSLLYKLRFDLSMNNEITEALFIEITNRNRKNIFIIAQ